MTDGKFHAPEVYVPVWRDPHDFDTPEKIAAWLSRPAQCPRCGAEFPGGGYCAGTTESPHGPVTLYASNE